MAFTLKSPHPLTQLTALSGPQWLELGAKRAPQLVAALAVLGIAWEAAQLTWLLLAPNQPATIAAPVSAPTLNRASINVQSIADAHLFGAPGAIGSADPNSLPQTQMSLVLAGTMALDDPQAGYAIIGENAANAKFYRVGSVINGGPRLHSVYADRVIIDRSGTLETLMLPRGTASTAPVPMVRNVSGNSVGDNLRRIAASNPSALGELLRAQPVFANGTQKGYRVYPGRDRQQFTRLGLQPGDLVIAINGTTLDDPNRGGDIFNTLVSSSTAQVTVERNGTNQQLSLDMAQLSLPDAPTDTSSASGGTPAVGVNGPPRNQRTPTVLMPGGQPAPAAPGGE